MLTETTTPISSTSRFSTGIQATDIARLTPDERVSAATKLPSSRQAATLRPVAARFRAASRQKIAGME